MPHALLLTGFLDDVDFLLVCFVLVYWYFFAGVDTTPATILILPSGDMYWADAPLCLLPSLMTCRFGMRWAQVSTSFCWES